MTYNIIHKAIKKALNKEQVTDVELSLLGLDSYTINNYIEKGFLKLVKPKTSTQNDTQDKKNRGVDTNIKTETVTTEPK